MLNIHPKTRSEMNDSSRKPISAAQNDQLKVKEQTQAEKLEALATRELPPNLQGKLQSVRDAIDSLKNEARIAGVEREFSPDGRFLGDVGELIAKIFYRMTLNDTQEKGHDAVEAEVDAVGKEKSGRKVEVKLRSRSTNIEFSEVPEMVLVIYVSPRTLKWGEVCYGSGAELLTETTGAKKLENGKIRTNCHKLMEAAKRMHARS